AEASEMSALELAQQFQQAGVVAIVYTDIDRDGMMQGVNVPATQALAESIDIPVIASGGVTDMDDIKAVYAAADSGVSGVITGRAIYEGSLDLATAQQWIDSQEAPF
ncbi:MAG: HisA/HisF-related TIM barrel protein, partial [Pseudomonadales bacterium]